MRFQHTAARRRLEPSEPKDGQQFKFQHTAARRRLALGLSFVSYVGLNVSTHSRPKAAGVAVPTANGTNAVSTHSRPKAAGEQVGVSILATSSFNTQPPEGGWPFLNL